MPFAEAVCRSRELRAPVGSGGESIENNGRRER